jgi:hypothetical protein
VYELAVYRVEEGVAEPEPVLSQRIPGTATTMTPSVDACPARGELYAWAVRAITPRGPSAWSEPLFFEVEVPSDDDVAWALEILSTRGGEQVDVGCATADTGRAERVVADSPTAISLLRQAMDARGGVVRTAAPAIVPSVPAALRVAGEVRTTDPRDPGDLSRLWGAGRVGLDRVNGRNVLLNEVPCLNDGLEYGLSDLAVEWGSAAHACPAGTWVCKQSEVAACNTVRNDSTFDGSGCNGTLLDFDADNHLGWLAGPDAGSAAAAMTEMGMLLNYAGCHNLPVWCCWE